MSKRPHPGALGSEPEDCTLATTKFRGVPPSYQPKRPGSEETDKEAFRKEVASIKALYESEQEPDPEIQKIKEDIQHLKSKLTNIQEKKRELKVQQKAADYMQRMKEEDLLL